MTTIETATHPIVDLVIRGLRKNGQEGYLLDAGQLELVKRALAAIPEVSEARRAVRELIQFAWLLETRQHSQKLARALLQVVGQVVDGMAARDARFADLRDELEANAARFARFNGQTSRTCAPPIERRRPADAFALAALVPVMLR